MNNSRGKFERRNGTLKTRKRSLRFHQIKVFESSPQTKLNSWIFQHLDFQIHFSQAGFRSCINTTQSTYSSAITNHRGSFQNDLGMPLLPLQQSRSAVAMDELSIKYLLKESYPLKHLLSY